MSLCAWGKIILFGEHAAVYGHPALAVGIPRGISARRLEPTGGALRISVAPWDLTADDEADGPVGDCLRLLSELVGGGPAGMEAELEARIPPGAGLGSSAALAVVLVRCLDRVRGTGLGDDEVRRLAHELEAVFHGRPSGLDDTLATYGGVCLFCRRGLAELQRPALEPLTDQAARLPWPVPALVVADSGVQRSTAERVAAVRRLHERDPEAVEARFARIDACLEDGLAALERGDAAALGAAMAQNQRVLAELELSCAPIDRLVELAGRAGAAGAKLTGAGGGGGVVAVAPGREQALVEAWRGAGFQAWIVPPAEAEPLP